MISSLVVDQHLDQLVVHDLHVHLQPANDDDADNGGDQSLSGNDDRHYVDSDDIFGFSFRVAKGELYAPQEQ